MGIPYSREINAAFDQVTPLVAAGYKVLRTTKNISILLAVIQVLTVLLLFMVFVALVGVMYCVNPDLEEERKQLVTPLLKSFAHLTLFSILKFVLGTFFVSALFAGTTWYLFVVLYREWRQGGAERAGDEDVDEALKDLDGKGKNGNKGDDKKGKNGKGKKEEGEENGKKDGGKGGK